MCYLETYNEVLVYGDFEELNKDNTEIYSYIRTLNGERMLIIINFFGREPVFRLPEDIEIKNTQLLLANYDVSGKEGISEIKLRPYETRIYRV